MFNTLQYLGSIIHGRKDSSKQKVEGPSGWRGWQKPQQWKCVRIWHGHHIRQPHIQLTRPFHLNVKSIFKYLLKAGKPHTVVSAAALNFLLAREMWNATFTHKTKANQLQMLAEMKLTLGYWAKRVINRSVWWNVYCCCKEWELKGAFSNDWHTD